MKSTVAAYLEAVSSGARVVIEENPSKPGELRVGFTVPAGFTDEERAAMHHTLRTHREYLKVLLTSEHPTAGAVRQEAGAVG
jgi:hypothetical protein